MAGVPQPPVSLLLSSFSFLKSFHWTVLSLQFHSLRVRMTQFQPRRLISAGHHEYGTESARLSLDQAFDSAYTILPIGRSPQTSYSRLTACITWPESRQAFGISVYTLGQPQSWVPRGWVRNRFTALMKISGESLWASCPANAIFRKPEPAIRLLNSTASGKDSR